MVSLTSSSRKPNGLSRNSGFDHARHSRASIGYMISFFSLGESLSRRFSTAPKIEGMSTPSSCTLNRFGMTDPGLGFSYLEHAMNRGYITVSGNSFEGLLVERLPDLGQAEEPRRLSLCLESLGVFVCVLLFGGCKARSAEIRQMLAVLR